MSAPPRVVIVHLGRREAMGARRRLSSTRELFESAGAQVDELALLRDCPVRPGDLAAPGLRAILRGSAPAETLAWSKRSAVARLRRLAPDVIVCTTLRAWHPALKQLECPVILDFVDRLSDSYRDRSKVLGRRPSALAFKALSPVMERVERNVSGLPATRVAAGYTDAAELGATWIPNLARPVATRGEARFDLGFVGSLSYPPNVEAIERLDAVWPEIKRRRPTVTLLLAGASPGQSVEAMARRNGWSLEADFVALADVLGAIRVAVVPLRHASGIQCKVLDAAAHGVAQVVDRVSLAGFGPGFPARVADDDDGLILAVLDLLDDPAARQALGDAGRRHVAQQYSTEVWSPWARSILDLARR